MTLQALFTNRVPETITSDVSTPAVGAAVTLSSPSPWESLMPRIASGTKILANGYELLVNSYEDGALTINCTVLVAPDSGSLDAISNLRFIPAGSIIKEKFASASDLNSGLVSNYLNIVIQALNSVHYFVSLITCNPYQRDSDEIRSSVSDIYGVDLERVLDLQQCKRLLKSTLAIKNLKHTNQITGILSYVLGRRVTVNQLWTTDYKVFIEGSRLPDSGLNSYTPGITRGTQYPTSRFSLSVDTTSDSEISNLVLGVAKLFQFMTPVQYVLSELQATVRYTFSDDVSTGGITDAHTGAHILIYDGSGNYQGRWSYGDGKLS